MNEVIALLIGIGIIIVFFELLEKMDKNKKKILNHTIKKIFNEDSESILLCTRHTIR